MSDDVWDNGTQPSPQTTVSPKALTLEDLQRLQATKSTAHMEIELCYHKSKVFVKPLKVNDKKEVLKAMESKNDVLVNKCFDNILQKYVEFEDQNLNYENISLQERFQILTYIRTANGEDTATIVHQCPNCEKVNDDIVYDLNDLFLKEYKGNPEEEIVVIPLQGEDCIKIQIKPLTRMDDMNAERYCKQNDIDLMSEKALVYMAAAIKRIVVVQGGVQSNVDISKFDSKVDYYKNLDGKTDSKIKDVIKSFDFGVKMPFDFTCTHCKHRDQKAEVNVAAFFIS